MYAQLCLNGLRYDVAKTEMGLVWAQDADGEDATNVLKAVPSCKACWTRQPPGVVVRGTLVDGLFCVDSIEGSWQPITLKATDGFLQTWGLLGLPYIEVEQQQPEADYFRLLQQISWGNKAREKRQWGYLADTIKSTDNIYGVTYREDSYRDNIVRTWKRPR